MTSITTREFHEKYVYDSSKTSLDYVSSELRRIFPHASITEFGGFVWAEYKNSSIFAVVYTEYQAIIAYEKRDISCRTSVLKNMSYVDDNCSFFISEAILPDIIYVRGRRTSSGKLIHGELPINQEIIKWRKISELPTWLRRQCTPENVRFVPEIIDATLAVGLDMAIFTYPKVTIYVTPDKFNVSRH